MVESKAASKVTGRKKKKVAKKEAIEVEEVIEIPVDWATIHDTLASIRREVRDVCSALGTDIAHEEFVHELQELGLGVADLDTRMRQLRELAKVLKDTKFTNKSAVDDKIRKKVIEEITKHFKFKPIDEVFDEDELIAIDDDVEVAPRTSRREPKIPDGPARNLSGVQSARAEARAEAMAERLPNSVYEQAANAQHGESPGAVGDAFYTGLPEGIDDLTPEEIRTAFPDMDPAILKKVEQLKRLAPKKMNAARGGISRRDS